MGCSDSKGNQRNLHRKLDSVINQYEMLLKQLQVKYQSRQPCKLQIARTGSKEKHNFLQKKETSQSVIKQKETINIKMLDSLSEQFNEIKKKEIQIVIRYYDSPKSERSDLHKNMEIAQSIRDKIEILLRKCRHIKSQG